MNEKETVVTEYPGLHEIAMVLDVPYARLNNKNVARKPIPDVVYKKDNINWDAVKSFVGRRLHLTKDKTGKPYNSVEEVFAAASQTVYVPKPRGNVNPNSVRGKFIKGTTPVRKGNLKPGDLIYDRKEKVEGIIVFTNESIVVYDIKGDWQPSRAVGNRVFNDRFDIRSE